MIKNDGSINYYCSSKCRKNALKLKRDKKKLKWTEFFHLARERATAQKHEEKAKLEEKEEKPAPKPKKLSKKTKENKEK